MEVGQSLGAGMVTDDQGQVAIELAGLLAVQEIGETMEVTGDEDGDVLRDVSVVQAPVHLELFGEGSKGGAEVLFAAAGVVQRKFDAHEEESEVDVLMLVGVQDIGVVMDEEVGDGGNDALAVRTIDQEDCGF